MRGFLFVLLLLVSCQSEKSSTLPILNYTFDENGNKKVYEIVYQNFLDQNGKAFNQETLKGHITISNFFFTNCPSICPPMQLKIAQVRKELNSKALITVSHTIDPKNDSITRLNEYSKNFTNNNEQWYFVRSEKESLDKLGALYKTNFDASDDNTDFFHSSIVTLLDRDLNIRGFYDILVESEKALLIEDIRSLL